MLKIKIAISLPTTYPNQRFQDKICPIEIITSRVLKYNVLGPRSLMKFNHISCIIQDKSDSGL